MLTRRVMILLLAALMHGCDDNAPTRTSLAALSHAQRDFNGRQVIVSGTLRTFSPPRHYWIENDALNRVALAEIDVPEAWVGQQVEVQGAFLYDPEAGRRIRVETLDPLE